eukprot:TRINITY_DN3261_c0_g2_i1.p1 TRINITY_DN3261_c0_g2~~TRINITY_DN3261_c0_g2_i1.p1  ORF type:complete len:541 (+),score=160.29 TRINITY_DN3261_c0_g2_i1:91-1713(+)
MNLREQFEDSITFSFYESPITTEYGHTFSKEPLMDWLSNTDNGCPYTGRKIDRNKLRRNLMVEALMEALIFNEDFYNSIDSEGLTLLAHAIKDHNMEQFKNLIYHTDLSQNINGEDYFIFSIRHNNLETLKDLISLVSNVNKRYHYEYTPLMLACNFNDTSVEIIKCLIDSKADLNALNSFGESSLMICIRNKRFDIIEQLLTISGLDLMSSADMNPLTYCMRYDCWDLFLTLVNFYENLPNFVELACTMECTKYLEYFMSCGVSLCSSKNQKQTPLHSAIIHGNAKILDILLSNVELDINVKNHKGETALMIASSIPDIEMTEKLLSFGAKDDDWEVCDNAKNSLTYSLRIDSYLVFKAIVDHFNIVLNANVLKFCILHKSFEIFEKILQFFIENNKLKTNILFQAVFEKIVLSDNVDFLKISLDVIYGLAQKMKKKLSSAKLQLITEKCFHIASAKSDNCIEFMMNDKKCKEYFDINCHPFEDKTTPLLNAIAHEQILIIQLLLTDDNVDITGAMDKAIEVNNDEIVDLLKKFCSKTQ